MRGRELIEMVKNYLIGFFEKIGEPKTRTIINKLKQYETIPQNIVGCIEKLNGEIRNTFEAQQYKPKNRDDLGDPETAGLFGEMMAIIFSLHKGGVAQYNHDNPCGIMDLDEWIIMGRPESWSPLIDTWLLGYEAACISETSQHGAVKKYMRCFVDNLKTGKLTYDHS